MNDTGWREAFLGEICTFKYGKALPQSSRNGGDIPVYGSNGVVGHHDSAITTGKTIVIGRKGSFGEVSFSSGPCWPIDTAYFVDETATEQDIKWLSYRLANLGLNQLNKAAAVPGLNRDDAYRQQLQVPPLPEQRRIAAILDQADALRAKRREALAQLDSLTQSIFIEMFGDALRNTHRIQLSELIEEFRYGTSNKSGVTGYPTLRIPNVTSGSIDFSELKTVEVEDAEFLRLNLQDGDLLFVRTNGNPDNVGRCAVFNQRNVADSGFDASEFIYASYLIRARMKKNTVLPVVLQQYLSSGEGRHALRARSKTSAGQFNINTEGLGALPIPSFPMPLQENYVRRKQAIEQQKIVHRTSMSELDALFASLQHRAFSGEL